VSELEPNHETVKDVQSIVAPSNKNLLTRAAGMIETLLVYISILLSAALTINLIAGVFFRYVLNSPIFWADELSILLFAWLTFLGGCIAVKRYEMAAVTIVLDRLSQKAKIVLNLVIQLLVLLFSGIICYYSYIWVSSPSVATMISSTLRVDMWWIFSIVPISMLCIAIFSLSNIVDEFIHYGAVNAKGGKQ
jgi:C4-dicarboxylate transporter, DctQ subunit